MLKKLSLSNFTAFKELEMEFSPGINVIIGENGTGKSHLLKTVYCLSQGTRLTGRGVDILHQIFNETFRPLDQKTANLRRNSNNNSVLQAEYATGEIAVTLGEEELPFRFHSSLHAPNPPLDATLIPAKEVLSFMKGFTSLYDKYELSFDLTYKTLCSSLDLPRSRSEELPNESKAAMDEIELVCGGRFIFHGGGIVTFNDNNREYSANAIAEGYRKIAMLSRLLENGTIQPGSGAPLLWDEPEANLNPKITRKLVEILLLLTRHGQQIILATHDYVLLKWFDLLADSKLGDQIKYYSLYQDPKTNNIALESADSYRELKNNPIADTFAELYDSEIDRSLGGKK